MQFLTVAFLDSSGTEVGSADQLAPLSGDTKEGVSLILGAGQGASITKGTDTIYLSGQWAVRCKVLSVQSVQGDSP